MAKQLFIATERMKKDFALFKEEAEFNQEMLEFMASELIYFAEYAKKNRIKTMYDLEEKLDLPFEAYLDAFETELMDSEDLDYLKALEAYKVLLTTFTDTFFFEEETISCIATLYFRNGDATTAEAFILGYLEEDNTSALAYRTLILGFKNIDLPKAKSYYEKAKTISLDDMNLIENIL